MIDEKNLQNEKLDDEELEKVAGGNGETPEVQNKLEYKPPVICKGDSIPDYDYNHDHGGH